MNSYKVMIDKFEGPLDLLLHLIKEDNMENIEALKFEELVELAKSTDEKISALEEEIKTKQESLKSLEEERVSIFAKLLVMSKEKNLKDEKVNNLFVTYFCKEDVTWLDDVGLLKELTKNNAKEFIKTVTKTTTSIDKNALKKAFKTNDSLREQYKDFYGTKLTEYVTVTTEENHAKMLEHIKG